MPTRPNPPSTATASTTASIHAARFFISIRSRLSRLNPPCASSSWLSHPVTVRDVRLRCGHPRPAESHAQAVVPVTGSSPARAYDQGVTRKSRLTNKENPDEKAGAAPLPDRPDRGRLLRHAPVRPRGGG